MSGAAELHSGHGAGDAGAHSQATGAQKPNREAKGAMISSLPFLESALSLSSAALQELGLFGMWITQLGIGSRSMGTDLLIAAILQTSRSAAGS